MTPARRHTPEVSPEQFDELQRLGRVEISDGNGRRVTLADVEGVLTRTSNTRAMMAQTAVFAVMLIGVVWRGAIWYSDLRHTIRADNEALRASLESLHGSLNARTTDRWWGQAEAIGEQMRVQKNPEYARTALSPAEIVSIQATVRERIANHDEKGNGG